MQRANSSYAGGPIHGKVLGILVGGGPAPGINGVIRAATIEARDQGLEVIGIRDGCKWLSQGNTDHIVRLDVDDVSRIHYLGGSILGTSRVNPTLKKEDMRRVLESLGKLKIDRLITIGGDDTAHTAQTIDRLAGPQIEVAHVPKTIDNDLPLPANMPTFGYQTARHLGTAMVQNIMEDAMTTSRWYYIVSMGRTAGHLALGIGKAAAATLVVIAEEYRDRPIRFSQLCDLLETTILKRIAMGRDYGVAILAEGLSEGIPPEDLAEIEQAERDEHGHVRFAEISLGVLLKNEVRRRLAARGIRVTIVPKNIGYELRCEPPIPFDMEYTQDLGFAAARYLLEGNTGALICMIEGRVVPVKFEDLVDPATGKPRVRRVDVDSDYYRGAREYMIRLEEKDFTNPEQLGRLAAVSGMSPEDFRAQFSYLGDPW